MIDQKPKPTNQARINLRLSEDIHSEIKQAAEETGISVPEFVRCAITQALKDPHEAVELAYNMITKKVPTEDNYKQEIEDLKNLVSSLTTVMNDFTLTVKPLRKQVSDLHIGFDLVKGAITSMTERDITSLIVDKEPSSYEAVSEILELAGITKTIEQITLIMDGLVSRGKVTYSYKLQRFTWK